MTTDQLRSLLRAADDLPVGPPPTDQIVRAGSRHVRGRRALAAGFVAAAVAGAVTAGVALSSSTQTGPEPTPQRPSTVPWVEIPGPAPHTHDGVEPPLDREPITLSLTTPGEAVQGDRYRFVVRISNSSRKPVSLKPCPYYRVQFLTVVETGYLNCAQAPPSVPAEGSVDFAMEVGVSRIGGHANQTSTLYWQLGGEGAEGRSVQVPVDVICCPVDGPPRPKPLTIDILHVFGKAQRYRAYTGPNPPAVSETEAVSKVRSTYAYSLGLRDVGMVHYDGKIDWYQVWIIAGDQYVPDLNALSMGGPALNGTARAPRKARPGWARSISMIDARTGRLVFDSVF